MTSAQKVFVFSLAVIMCLSLSTVTAAANEVDEAKAALIEYLLPELVNSPEYQAKQVLAVLEEVAKRGGNPFNQIHGQKVTKAGEAKRGGNPFNQIHGQKVTKAGEAKRGGNPFNKIHGQKVTKAGEAKRGGNPFNQIQGQKVTKAGEA